MNNIFEGAKFGDKFLTDKNIIAIYVNHGTKYHTLVLDKGNGFIYCNDNGDDFTNHETLYNIISRYQEPIDEEKLNELAKNTRIYYDEYRIICKDEDEIYYAEDLDVVFKAGYRKAKEE